MAEEKKYKFKINYNLAKNIDRESNYATHMVVQHLENEFIVSFFEFRPPIVVGPPEEIEKELEIIESASMECVARIVVSAERLQGFINALQENLNLYQQKGNQED